MTELERLAMARHEAWISRPVKDLFPEVVNNLRQIPCRQCQKLFWWKPIGGKPKIFCSSDCKEKFYKGQVPMAQLERIYIACVQCEKPIKVPRLGNRRRFCTPACKNRYGRETAARRGKSERQAKNQPSAPVENVARDGYLYLPTNDERSSDTP